jgi:hypothetical protein
MTETRKIFLGGSRRLERLGAAVIERMESVVADGLRILLGDAVGIDLALQRYLASVDYRNVEIFHSGECCRCNVGSWPTRAVSVDRDARDFHYYAAKDVVMSDEADYGLMIWDGASAGTANNVLNLLERRKRAVVYHSPNGEFLTFSGPGDADQLLVRLPAAAAAEVEQQIRLGERIAALQQMALPETWAAATFAGARDGAQLPRRH